jgi:hypothetical protein
VQLRGGSLSTPRLAWAGAVLVAAGLIFGFLLWPVLDQPLRIYELRHAHGAQTVTLHIDRVAGFCGAKTCSNQLVGHYILNDATISNVTVYPRQDLVLGDSMSVIVSPSHEHTAVPTDAHGYYAGALGVFATVFILALLFVMIRYALTPPRVEG